MSNQAHVITQAKKEIKQAGFNVVEDVIDGDQCHIVLTKNGKRHGWGMFPRLYCWTEVYEFATGKSWLNLVPRG